MVKASTEQPIKNVVLLTLDLVGQVKFGKSIRNTKVNAVDLLNDARGNGNVTN